MDRQGAKGGWRIVEALSAGARGQPLHKHHERQGEPDARERARYVAMPAEGGGLLEVLRQGACESERQTMGM